MITLVPSTVAQLQPWVDAGVLGAAEVHGAAVVAELLHPVDPDVVLAFALALRAPQRGHSCIDLDAVAEIVATETAVARADDADSADAAGGPELPWPATGRWRESLLASAAVRTVDAVDTDAVLDDRPLVVHGTRVYTQRQWTDECSVVAALRRRGANGVVADVAPAARALLDRLLPGDGDRQREAVDAALGSSLTVILGGPGTGKTHAVACLLAALCSDADDDLRIGLAAPTGKAAARLTETIAAIASGGRQRGDIPPPVADRLTELTAVTIHRLLGPRPDHRSRFRHDAAKPLPLDVLVVDETSMVPLPLMARLLETVPDACRLVLVGDPDQLKSIEVGAVLGDVASAAGRPESRLHGRALRLERQHRTAAGSIGELREAVRSGDAEAALSCLRTGDYALRFVELADGEPPSVDAVAAVRQLVEPAFAAARAAAAADAAGAALAAAETARILCAHRRGPFGAEDWNRHVESWLPADATGRTDRTGRVLLATRNDPRTGVSNGDTGVLVRHHRRLAVAFRRGADVRHFDPAELDDLDVAFAMTVHKSQGSEYDDVAVVHPPAASPLAGRELLYTAITRAKRRLLVLASAESIRRAVQSPARRVTGLADALQ